ncbi:DUF2279 domain-containing protein [Flavobacterium sp. WC2409]
MKYKAIFFLMFFLVSGLRDADAQNNFDRFLKPSDTLNIKRQNTVILSESILASTALVGLNQLWYADYPRSNFHFINDNAEWLQMDKIGHFYSSYQMGRMGSEMLQWSGASKKKQLLYGAGLGFAFLTAVEVLDGYSSEWGASPGDVIANASGTALYVSQELLWNEQRIIPKFSFHTTQFAQYRPNVLGSNLAEQILKDYNGQTYWLSVNLYSFSKGSKIPKWLNLAMGYGADGMVSGNSENSDKLLLPKTERFRQFYLSFDVDLTKIETKSHFLKTFFSVFNTLKIPAPTIEYSVNEGFRGRILYF